MKVSHSYKADAAAYIKNTSGTAFVRKDLGRNFCPSQCSALNIELENRKAKIESLELQLKSLQARISNLESDMETGFDSTSCSEQESLCCSSPSSSPSCSSIDETNNSPRIGKTTKKRIVQKKCRQVMAYFSDIQQVQRIISI
ncbi:hypothetical protein ACROYT_G014906 [Oculina patagonica]